MSFFVMLCIVFYACVQAAVVMRNDGFIGSMLSNILENDMGMFLSNEIADKSLYEDLEEEEILIGYVKKEIDMEWLEKVGKKQVL